MTIKVLIATPIRSFGELISQALQEIGPYQVLLTDDTAKALARAKTEAEIRFVLIDCKMPAPGTKVLLKDLRTVIPDLKYIVMHLNEDCHPENAFASPHGFDLEGPFFLPDLLEAIERLDQSEQRSALAPPVQEPDDQALPEELAWLEDVNRAAQYLMRLSLEAGAQAALITRDARVWAYAGQLPQEATEELAQYVGQHLDANAESGDDLARFLRLKTTASEFMLYATGLGSGFVLSLAFEAQMPFSEMRAQAANLARRLTTPDAAFTYSEALAADPPNGSNGLVDDLVDVPVEPRQDNPMLEREQALMEELLATMDVPDPDVQLYGAAEQPLDEHGARSESLKMDAPESEPDLARNGQVEIQLEPESGAVHDLAYVCVIAPRLPSHELTGDMAALLSKVVPRFCLAFDWRLEHITIEPAYLQWAVSAGPDVSAARVIREIRTHTSRAIFEEFPRLAKENPSGEFWASGYMVVHGRRSLSDTVIEDYLRQVRQRQGVR